jgi:hypothetical protein
MAYVMRPELDLALRRVVLRSPAVTIVPTLDPHASRTAARVIDASGRTAVSAVRRVRPTEPFVARTITATEQFARAARAFQLAAMPDGYVYRLGAPALLTFGIVAPKRFHSAAVARKLRQLGLGWILTGLPSLETMAAGRSGIASVQWSEGPHHPIRVGDAALARDSLSSQGMANGLSDAVQASENETGLWRRHKEERQAHLASLMREIERCWCGSSCNWVAYKTFLRGHLDAMNAVSVRNGDHGEHNPGTRSVATRWRYCAARVDIPIDRRGGNNEASEAGAPPQVDTERRQLTVMFCDVVGSTALLAGSSSTSLWRVSARATRSARPDHNAAYVRQDKKTVPK